METAPTATITGVIMNKFTAVIFVISTILAGVFALSMDDSSDETFIPTQATIGDQTTYDETYSSFYTCTANIHFTYSATEDNISHTGTVIGSMESSQSCIDEIQSSYPIASTITIYYSNLDNTVHQFQQSGQDISENLLYSCCSGFFGLISLISLVMTFSMGTKGSASPTGGLTGRVNNLGATSTDANQGNSKHFQTLPSQQGMGQNKSEKRRKRWKDGTMPPGRIRNYDSIIHRLNLKNGIKSRGLTSIDEAKAYVNSFGIMNQQETERFFANSHVTSTLGLSQSTQIIQNISIQDSVVMGNPASEFNSSPSQESPSKDFWSRESISTTQAKSSDGTCGHSGCSSSVDSFDFRCFDCRKRFCSTHRGKTFQCSSCAN